MTHYDSVSSIPRRDFLKASGVTSAALFASQYRVMAGPFSNEELPGHLIPADKKLTDDWLASLTQRGKPERLSGDELKYVGMPVGGIGCGQLYLGGDGRLWHWDIFKSNYIREKHEMKMSAMTMGGHYPYPVAIGEEYNYQNGAEVEQGFAIRVQSGDTVMTRSLNQQGFPDVSFRGEYPVGKVSYSDAEYPAKVELEAFSPFIPLNTKDSALPVTVMRFTVSNTLDSAIEVDLGGWLQNAVCPYTEDATLGERSNEMEQGKGRKSILSRAVGSEGITKEHGYGSLALTVLEDAGLTLSASASVSDCTGLFDELKQAAKDSASTPLTEPLLGGVSASTKLEAGASKTITFLVSWYFPYHQKNDVAHMQMFTQRHYRPWFESAGEVAQYVADRQEALIDATLLWNATWNDSSLPHWLLDRSMIPLDCVATQTFNWFEDGTPWSWEGVDCCEGTCTHVFHYAQAMGRIFPELERILRERVDYGAAFKEDGGIGYRGEATQFAADDGQAGTILRVYREHQVSPDSSFLRRLWPRVKQSIEYLMAKDPNEDGILTGAQPHTLDAEWTGQIAWLSSMYLASLSAGEAMAVEMGDDDFAEKCRRILDQGYESMVTELFDGEYFIHKPDESMGEHLNTNRGCHIDQVLGQAWVHQVGLGRILPKKETVSALESLWKYNFAPDAGGYALKHREIEQAFRWYAMEGEAGLLMTTFPKGGAKDAIPGDALRSVENPVMWTGPGGYFNECMNGFEYQVAWHMVAEGDADDPLVEKGLAVMKAVHDRYAANKRNPYNEIECSDHYVRSMASYGIFLAACGFTYHGPKGEIGFNPKIQPEDFKAPFTAAEGWGTYRQQLSSSAMHGQLELKWGALSVQTIRINPRGFIPTKLEVLHLGKPVPAELKQVEGFVVVELAERVELSEQGLLEIQLS